MTKNRFRTTLLVGLAASILLIDALAALEAQAVFGTRRRTALLTAAVVHDKDTQDAAAKSQEQQQASTEQQATAPKQEAAPEQAAAPSQQPAAAVPVGTVVRTLPAGCQETTVKNVAYQKCGAAYYRAAFQGSDLVYVATSP